jgi:hypothetical protein
MKCQDVRRTLSLLVDGQLALTESAIIQGHLLGCAECRKEVDRLQVLAGVRARAKHRRATVATLVAMAVLLAVAAGGGFYIYQGSLPDFPPWGSTPAPPRTAAPTAPVPEPVAPVAPAPAPAPRPSPPLPARSKAAVEATPWGTAPPTAESVPRATRPAATAEAPPEDRMPTTQARPPAVLNAPPDAEAMPTQAPSRPVPRSRP